MKGLINGEIRELTKEEIEKLNNIQLPQIITDKQRISALENAFAEFVLSLTGGDIQ